MANHRCHAAFNRRNRKKVGEGEPPITIRGSMMGAEIAFTFQVPPQPSEERLFELARRQLQAFFYFLTYSKTTCRGGFWIGEFCPVTAVRHADWGNAQLLWFEEYTKDWIFWFHGIGAEGFFKLWIKRKSDSDRIWAWALEWNRNFRLAGFFGDPSYYDQLTEAVPPLEMGDPHRDGNQIFRAREEVSLAPEEDHLFDSPIAAAASMSPVTTGP